MYEHLKFRVQGLTLNSNLVRTALIGDISSQSRISIHSVMLRIEHLECEQT